MIHEFGWANDDWNRLAAGTIAGHISSMRRASFGLATANLSGAVFLIWQTLASDCRSVA